MEMEIDRRLRFFIKSSRFKNRAEKISKEKVILLAVIEVRANVNKVKGVRIKKYKAHQ